MPLLTPRLALCFLSCLVLIAGCGGSASSPQTSTNSGEAPSITQQPASATVPLGEAAKLSVSATGSPAPTYQWTENGSPIAGATSATLTTPALALADSGDKFVVRVTNSAGSVVSSPAVITIGPRTPDPRDLRFKHVGFPQPLAGLIHSAVPGAAAGYTFQTWEANTVGTPLEVGSAGICAGTAIENENCSWSYTLFAPPSGTQGFFSFYSSDVIANLEADLTQVGSLQNAVMTTLDEEAPYNLLAYAYEQDQTVSAGFSQTLSTVSPGDIESTVERLAAQGGVVTAVSINSAGLLDVVSYTWSGAPSAAYDAQSILATDDAVGDQAASLAASGYILTAVGANGPGNFVLVGTKVHGDTLPRPFAYGNDEGTIGSSDPDLVDVGYVFAQNSNAVFAEK